MPVNGGQPSETPISKDKYRFGIGELGKQVQAVTQGVLSSTGGWLATGRVIHVTLTRSEKPNFSRKAAHPTASGFRQFVLIPRR